MPLDILYPNGKVEAVQVFVDSISGPIPWDGSVSGGGGIPASVIVAGTLGALNATVTLPTTGLASATIFVTGGALVGTVALIGTVDGSADTKTIEFMDSDNFQIASQLPDNQASGYTFDVRGYSQVVAKVSAYTSGSLNVSLVGSPLLAPPTLVAIANRAGAPPAFKIVDSNGHSMLINADGTLNASIFGDIGKALQMVNRQLVVDTPETVQIDTFTAAAQIGGLIFNQGAVLQHFGFQVVSTGTPATSWTIVLEGSIDNQNFTTILTASAVEGAMVWSTLPTPCRYARVRCVALVLAPATNVKVYTIATCD